jgi:hypothetical protein
VLVEGDYSGVLRPHEHYIELKRDYSNLDEVLDLIERDEVREEITEAAYRDVIESGLYTYESFVDEVEDTIEGIVARRPAAAPARALAVRKPWEGVADRASWGRVIYTLKVWPRLHELRHRWLIFRQRRLSPYAPHRVVVMVLAGIRRRLSKRS